MEMLSFGEGGYNIGVSFELKFGKRDKREVEFYSLNRSCKTKKEAWKLIC